MNTPKGILNAQTGNQAFIFNVPRREEDSEWEAIVYLEPLPDKHAVIAFSDDDGDFISRLTFKNEVVVESKDNPCLDDALLSLQETIDPSITSWSCPQTLGE